MQLKHIWNLYYIMFHLSTKVLIPSTYDMANISMLVCFFILASFNWTFHCQFNVIWSIKFTCHPQNPDMFTLKIHFIAFILHVEIYHLHLLNSYLFYSVWILLCDLKWYLTKYQLFIIFSLIFYLTLSHKNFCLIFVHNIFFNTWHVLLCR